LLDMEADMHQFGPALLAQVKDQWVITANNGFLSLLKNQVGKVFEDASPKSKEGGTFTVPNTYLPLLKQIMETGTTSLQPAGNLQGKAGVIPVVSDTSLGATVICVGQFGNAVANITREDLERVAAGRGVRIRLDRHGSTERIYSFFGEVQVGDMVCVWTRSGHLQVSIYHGDAARLFGLEKGKMITIEFT